MSQIHLSYKLDLAPESTWLTVNPTATAKSNLIYVQELGDFIAGPEYFTTRRNLPSYLIKYTLSGEGIMDPAKPCSLTAKTTNITAPHPIRGTGAWCGSTFTAAAPSNITIFSSP